MEPRIPVGSAVIRSVKRTGIGNDDPRACIKMDANATGDLRRKRGQLALTLSHIS